LGGLGCPTVLLLCLALGACAPPAQPTPTAAPRPTEPAAALPSPTAVAPAPTAVVQPTATLQGHPTATPVAVGTPPQSAAETPRRGGTLVIGTTSDPGQLNPGLTTASGTHLVTGNIYSGLLQFDERLEPQPNLAESWQVSPDGRTYTFQLRSGVVWHDGQPFTSADVKFSFEEVLLKFHARTKAGLEKVLERIETPDARTVVFRFKQPYAPLLRRLDVVEAPILPKHVYEGTDVQKNEANLKPVGTGPFKLAEYVRGDRVRLVRNERYFKPGLPYVDEVVFRIIPNETALILALEQGEVDYAASVPGAEIARLQANPNVRLVRAPAGPGGSFCIDQIIFNLTRPPLDRLEVRRAFAHAVNRQQILEQVRFGQGRVAIGPIASTMAWAHNPNVPQYEFSPQRASALLDQAGLPRKDGAPRFSVTFVHATAFQRTAEVVRQNLAEVGVEVKLETLEVNAANERVFVKKDFDLGIGSYCNGPDPEVGVTRAYVSSNIGPIPFSNGASYRNPRVDELFERAAATVDQAERAKLYGEIQQVLVQDLPYLWLVETELFRAHRAEVRGLRVWAGDLVEPAWTAK
jgi:peptide/nickel transport system substrate-binding protein